MSNKAIFLDRDDTLIEDPGYINSSEQIKLLDGVAEALGGLKSLGYKLVVVTNQSAVARGIVSEKTLGEIHNRLKQLLAEKGAFLDGIYYCPYHPDGAIPKYRKESDLRKPNPGMLLAAAEEMDIDLSNSWCIGNSNDDIEAGRRAGCKTILIDNSLQNRQLGPGEPKPDHKAVNMKEAVNIIKKHLRSPYQHASPAQSNPTSQRQAVEEQVPLQSAAAEINEPEQEPGPESTEWLLARILEQLRSMQRNDMFDEFSITRVLAGVVQVIVLFCLLISIWFLMSPTRQDNGVLISLGFAVVLQVMALTLYIMHRPK